MYIQRKYNFVTGGLYIAPNTPEFCVDLVKVMGFHSNDVVYLPNIYYPEKLDLNPIKHKHDNILRIGLFGAVRPFKNTLCQAAAAIKYANYIGRELHLHVNSNRFEQKGDQVFQNLVSLFDMQTKHKLQYWEWMPHNIFVRLVRCMDIGMQVSFTESFNIVAADFVANNIPLVGSPEIKFIPKGMQADPNSTEDMVKALRVAHSYWGKVLTHKSNAMLRNLNAKNAQYWNNFIEVV